MPGRQKKLKGHPMQISVIIPALNEEENIGEVVRQTRNRGSAGVAEIIVVDGGSSDETVKEASEAGATVVRSVEKGRAIQMNTGARQAKGPVLYFLHADTLPPNAFDRKILQSVEEGYPSGCFQLGFDCDHPLLRFYEWCTRFNIDAFRFGDQSLFVKRELFRELKGFNPKLQVMEDNEMVRKIKKENSFKIIEDKVITSARKYKANGVLRLQLIFLLIYVLFFLGLSQENLVSTYKRLITNRETDYS